MHCNADVQRLKTAKITQKQQEVYQITKEIKQIVVQ